MIKISLLNICVKLLLFFPIKIRFRISIYWYRFCAFLFLSLYKRENKNYLQSIQLVNMVLKKMLQKKLINCEKSELEFLVLSVTDYYCGTKQIVNNQPILKDSIAGYIQKIISENEQLQEYLWLVYYLKQKMLKCQNDYLDRQMEFIHFLEKYEAIVYEKIEPDKPKKGILTQEIEDCKKESLKLLKIGKRPEINRLERLSKRINEEIDFLNSQESLFVEKIYINPSFIGTIIGVLSSVFFIYGYIYCWLFFGAFDLDISLYFTFSDYAARSVDKIFSNSVYAIFLILMVLIPDLKTCNNVTPERKIMRCAARFKGLSFLCVLAAIIGYKLSSFTSYIGIIYAFFLYYGMYFILIFCLKGFRSYNVIVTVILLFIFSLGFFRDIFLEVVKHKNPYTLKHVVKVDFYSNLQGAISGKYIMLGLSNKFTFLMEKSTAKISIIPDKEIKKITPLRLVDQ